MEHDDEHEAGSAFDAVWIARETAWQRAYAAKTEQAARDVAPPCPCCEVLSVALEPDERGWYAPTCGSTACRAEHAATLGMVNT